MDDLQMSGKIGQYGDFRSANGREQNRTYSTAQSAFMHGFPSSFSNAKGTIDRAAKIVEQQIEDEVSFLQSDISEKDKTIEDLRQRRDNLKTGYDALRLNYDTLESRYSDLSAKFDKQKAEKEKAQVGYNQVVGALKKISRQVSDLTQQIADKDKQIEDLKNLSQETLSAKQEEINELEKNIRSLRNQRGSDRSTIQNLEQQLAQAREYHQYLSDQLTGVLFLEEDLTDDIIRLEEEKHALNAQLDEANEKNERLSQELAVTRQQLEQTEADLQQTRERLQQFYDTFKNIETADKQEAIVRLKVLLRLIQDDKFSENEISIRSTSGLWRGALSSLEDIQGEIYDLELEFAKDQGPDYCVNQIINELTQPEIVDPDGSLDRINMLARAYFSVPDQRPIGEAIVEAVIQKDVPGHSIYQSLCKDFGFEEAQKMAVSVLNDQSITKLCQEVDACFKEGALDHDSINEFAEILEKKVPEAVSQCLVKAACGGWGRQAIECLKNEQEKDFLEIANKIVQAKKEDLDLKFFINFFLNLEADEIEKQVKEFRENYRIQQDDGSVIQEEEAFFDELDGAVQAMRNFEFDGGDLDQARETLFKCFDPVLQVLAQRAYTAGETVFLRDARTLFDSILARSESFVEKNSFEKFASDEGKCREAFDFASEILPNIDKCKVDGATITGAEGTSLSINRFDMFDLLQKTVGHYAFQVGNNLLSQYQETFKEFLSSYVLKNSKPESIAGLMRLPVICGSYNYALGAPAELLDTVSNVESDAESLRKAYLLSLITGSDGSEIAEHGEPVIEIYNKIIEIADAAKSPDQYESLLQQAEEEGTDFGGLSFEDLKNMCLKYAMSRDFIEAYQNLDGSFSDAINFVFDEYRVIPPFTHPHRDLIGLGLNPNLIGSFAGSSVSEQASQRAEQWKQGQLAQDGVSYEAYQAASAIREAVNVTNAGFWHQVGDSLIDIGREFCEVLKKGDAPEEDIESIRNHFYALIRECETNGGVGIIPQTLPF